MQLSDFKWKVTPRGKPDGYVPALFKTQGMAKDFARFLNTEFGGQRWVAREIEE